MEISDFFKQIQEQSDLDKKRIAELEAVIATIHNECESIELPVELKQKSLGLWGLGLAVWTGIAKMIPTCKTVLWIALAAGVLFAFSNGTITEPDRSAPTPPVIHKDEIPMTAKEKELVESAIELVKQDIANLAITDLPTAKAALKAEMPTAVREAVIAEVKAETLAELPAVLDDVKKKIVLQKR